MKAFVIYGPPGAGKGTQANLLADKFSLIHFDTGKYLESVINDSSNKDNPIIQREKKLFDGGSLLTPAWVLEVVKKEVNEIGKCGLGIVFSGSPRTLYEAFGDGQEKGLMSDLEKLYGRDNVFVIFLKIAPETSIHRNRRRFVCTVCGRPVLYFNDNQPQHCGFCGGPLRKRSLDDVEVIKKRLTEFEKRTFPIIAEMRKNNYHVWEINGEDMPYKIFAEIVNNLELRNGTLALSG